MEEEIISIPSNLLLLFPDLNSFDPHLISEEVQCPNNQEHLIHFRGRENKKGENWTLQLATWGKNYEIWSFRKTILSVSCNVKCTATLKQGDKIIGKEDVDNEFTEIEIESEEKELTLEFHRKCDNLLIASFPIIAISSNKSVTEVITKKKDKNFSNLFHTFSTNRGFFSQKRKLEDDSDMEKKLSDISHLATRAEEALKNHNSQLALELLNKIKESSRTSKFVQSDSNSSRSTFNHHLLIRNYIAVYKQIYLPTLCISVQAEVITKSFWGYESSRRKYNLYNSLVMDVHEGDSVAITVMNRLARTVFISLVSIGKNGMNAHNSLHAVNKQGKFVVKFPDVSQNLELWLLVALNKHQLDDFSNWEFIKFKLHLCT